MRFFFDRCMHYKMAHVIQTYEGKNGHVIVHHNDDDRFHEKTVDVEWIKALAADRSPLPWVILSGDGNILKNKVERRALREASLPFFCMAPQWVKMPMEEYAWKFMKAWPKIKKMADPYSPLIYQLSAGQSLELVLLSR
jgi:hypothetical protein